MRRCAEKEKEKENHCVPEAPSAEQVSERYRNEARSVGTRCCMDPEVVLCVDQRGAVRKGKKHALFLYSRLVRKIHIRSVQFIVLQ